jgi:hypothetical protein
LEHTTNKAKFNLVILDDFDAISTSHGTFDSAIRKLTQVGVNNDEASPKECGEIAGAHIFL